MKEEKKLCIARVSSGLFGRPTRQCRGVAKYGDYCALHNPEYLQRKDAAKQRRWDAKRTAREREHIARVIGDLVIQHLEDESVLGKDWAEAGKYAPAFLLSLYRRRCGARE